MADIIKFEKKEPHLEGTALCLSCRHEWEAVVPKAAVLETDWLQCPACHLQKAKFKWPFYFGESNWNCGCGNDLFRISPDFVYCPNCGREQVFPKK